MKLYLIRHGMTSGNREHRYVGCTDEPILEEAWEELAAVRDKLREKGIRPDRLYVSPMLRCRQTAEILFPEKAQLVEELFRECDFGEFEYKNYGELNGNPGYQRFIDSNGESGFPGGETLREFQRRCVRGFESVLAKETAGEEQGTDSLALVVHGGTIMAVLDAFSVPHRDYYDWQVKNGEGFEAVPERKPDTGEIVLKDIGRL